VVEIRSSIETKVFALTGNKSLREFVVGCARKTDEESDTLKQKKLKRGGSS
jgi:hypothetical protein